jgi:hypothetical protein
MDSPRLAVHIVETRTGRVVHNEMPVMVVPDCNRSINDDSTIQIQIAVGDRGVPEAGTLRQLISNWRFSIAVSYGPSVVGSPILSYGPIMAHKFDDTSGVLTVGAGSMWALLARRLLLNPLGVVSSPLSMDEAMDAKYLGMTLWGIARELVDDTLSRGTGFELPIDLPSPSVGEHDRNYPVYDLATVGQRVKDLTQVEAGPDIDWNPYFSDSGMVRVAMRTGTPSLTQIGQDLIWDYGSSITTCTVDNNAASMATDVFGRGNATERASQVAWASNRDLVPLGWPVLETVDTSHQSVEVFDTLQSHANEWVRFYRNAVETWEAEVKADAAPMLGTYLPGDSGLFNMQSHAWIPKGLYRQRILGWSLSGPQRVKLLLEATEGAA